MPVSGRPIMHGYSTRKHTSFQPFPVYFLTCRVLQRRHILADAEIPFILPVIGLASKTRVYIIGATHLHGKVHSTYPSNLRNSPAQDNTLILEAAPDLSS
ncbi:hypothetical protein TWF569_005794 [Orbilia oligospora]|nr:hypothetical protein TWF706_008937 [Orbilia oligospora]KAF3148456.1 hypothetical protein TWF569_005794 [Orbilia oligospora]KAF3151488.1 hypothetical protein TWF594_007129 [Orbilia oligospora]